jgi:methylase of polypeptide subunit release factors
MLSRADNGGPDGWAVLDRIIHEAPTYLKSQGRPVFTLFGLLGVQRALQELQATGLDARILARVEQPFPRIARERLEHIRSVDVESALPAGRPATCTRLVLCGQKG